MNIVSAIRHRYHAFLRLASFLFALHIFNLSIDPRDKEPDFLPEDLSVNEIESIAELVMESVFGFSNTFAEHDEADGSEGTNDFNKGFCVAPAYAVVSQSDHYTREVQYFVFDSLDFSLPVRDILAPPPKALS